MNLRTYAFTTISALTSVSGLGSFSGERRGEIRHEFVHRPGRLTDDSARPR